MPVKLQTKKIVREGEKCREIINWEGIMNRNELPFEYVNESNMFFQSCQQKGGIYLYKNNSERYIIEGSTFSETCFQEILNAMIKAGEKLHKIREKEKELKKSWNGIETFTI
jgi:hypothetical protein